MTINTRPITLEAFETFVNRPENAERFFELIGGEIVEMPSNVYASFIGSVILTMLMNFVLKHQLGYVSGEQGGYLVAGEIYAPDVAFISKTRQASLPREGFNPNPPDLAVEVISPSDRDRMHLLRIKISNYLYAGTVVWVVNPDTKQVEIHAPTQKVRILGIADTLDGGEVLPGFSLAVKDIFVEIVEIDEDAMEQ